MEFKTKLKKYMFFFTSLLAVVMLSIFIAGCGGAKPNTPDDLKVDKVSIISSTAEDFVQLAEHNKVLYIGKVGEKADTLIIKFELNNPSKLEIETVKVNGKTYYNPYSGSGDVESHFISDSFYTSVSVRYKDYNSKSSGDKFKIESLSYKTSMARITVPISIEMDVIYNPKYTMIYDLSDLPSKNLKKAFRLSEEEEAPKSLSFTKSLLEPITLGITNELMTLSELSPTGLCPVGMVFLGWYIKDKDMLVNPKENSPFIYTMDIEVYPKHEDRYVFEDYTYNDEDGLKLVGVNIIPVKYKDEVVMTGELKMEYIPNEYYDANNQKKPVLAIGADLFKNLRKKDFTIVLGDNLKVIEKSAFEGVEKLKIDLFNVEVIGEKAFKDCGVLKLDPNSEDRSSFSSNLKEIGDQAFYKTTIENFYIKNNFEEYDEESDSMIVSDVIVKIEKSVFFPNTLERLGNEVFAYSETEKAYFEHNFEFSWDGEPFGEGLFKGNKKLKEVYFGVYFNSAHDRWLNNEVSTKAYDDGFSYSIPKDCFSQSSAGGQLNKVTLVEGLEIIWENAFFLQEKLKNIGSGFPNSLRKISNKAFESVPLERASFGDDSQLEFIGERAFAWSNFMEIELGKKVATIEKNAFLFNSYLEAVFLNSESAPSLSFSTVEALIINFKFFVNKGILETTRGKNEAIKDFILDRSYVYKEWEGVNFTAYVYEEILEEIDEVKIISIYGSIPTTLKIPTLWDGKKIVEIGSYVIIKEGVRTASLPATIKTIADRAFRRINTLETLEFYDSSGPLRMDNDAIELESIGIAAFKGTALKKFESTKNLKEIGGEAFENCKFLKTVEIRHGKNLTIGVSAFSYHLLEEGALERVFIGEDSIFADQGIKAGAFSGNGSLKIAFIGISSSNKFNMKNPALGLNIYTNIFSDCPEVEIYFKSQGIYNIMTNDDNLFKQNEKTGYTLDQNWKLGYWPLEGDNLKKLWQDPD